MAHAGNPGEPAACSTTVQLALVHPKNIPSSLAPLVPALPSSIPASAESALVTLRLPT